MACLRPHEVLGLHRPCNVLGCWNAEVNRCKNWIHARLHHWPRLGGRLLRDAPDRRAGYVLTADLVQEIAAGAALKPHNHALFKLEDIAMGSWIEHIQQERNIRVRIAQPAPMYECQQCPTQWRDCGHAVPPTGHTANTTSASAGLEQLAAPLQDPGSNFGMTRPMFCS